MKNFLAIISYIIFVFGITIGLDYKNLLFILISIIGGFLLLGVSKIIGIAEGINKRVLQLPLTYDQFKLVMKYATQYSVESNNFEVYPNLRTQYSFLCLDEETYINSDVFHNYLNKDGFEFMYKLPDTDPQIIMSSGFYYKGVELFLFEGQYYVMLKRLNLKPIINGNKLILELMQ
jgi:hypothetical protein